MLLLMHLDSVCQRPSCRQPFDPDDSSPVCHFHPGAPFFHDGQAQPPLTKARTDAQAGLRSWTCCKDVNKPVLTFDEFLAIPPCATGTHTLEAPNVAVAPSSTVENATAAMAKADLASKPKPKPEVAPAVVVPPRPERAAVPPAAVSGPLEDPPDVVPSLGAVCKRSGCGARFEEGSERTDDECLHHPGSTVFHEGSKVRVRPVSIVRHDGGSHRAGPAARCAAESVPGTTADVDAETGPDV